MRVTLALALSVLLLVPSALAQTTHERNVGYLWSLLGDADPATPATMPDGRVVPLAQAIDEAAARAGSVDLAALATGSAVPGGEYVGDIWLLSYGSGGCSNVLVAPGSPSTVPADPQMWVYSGGVGMMSGHGFVVQVYAWTMKSADTYFNADWQIAGNTDFYCIGFGGMHFAFPFVNGRASVG